MPYQLKSHCKVNLLLNILRRREDGFHELETLMQPIRLFDELTFDKAAAGVTLTCDHPEVPTDATNLATRAAAAVLAKAGIAEGVSIHLEKKIPVAAGVGGGSGNAAAALLGVNQLYGAPLSPEQLYELAATIGSDVPFLLQDQPALALGRGEKVTPVAPFPALEGKHIILVNPGFGVSTPWAYKSLAEFPEALNGRPGRAEELANLLQNGDLDSFELYNSLEAPVHAKYPILPLIKEYFLREGAVTALMSGSGSTSFAIARDASQAVELMEKFRARFGDSFWMTSAPLS